MSTEALPEQPRDLIVERDRLARLLAAESARVAELTAERDALAAEVRALHARKVHAHDILGRDGGE